MQATPHYPDFKPLSLEDRDPITAFFHQSPPVTSELTFTNLFMWRQHYNTIRPLGSLDYKPPAPGALLPLASHNLQVGLSQNVVQL